MREKMKQRVVQYVVLMAGILALLSVVIPHHHHRDGMPCYQSLTAEQPNANKAHNPMYSGAQGNNLPFYSRQFKHLMKEKVQFLFNYMVTL